MRPFLLALVLAAASAGCLGGSEDASRAPTDAASDAPTSAPTPEASPTPPTSPAPEQAPAPAPTPAPEPTPPPAPKKVYEASFDFAREGDPTGQSPKTQATAPVSAEHTLVRIEITLTRSGSAPAVVPVSGTLNSPTVRILDATGAEVLAVSEEGATTQEVPAVPGEWTVRYEGAGTLAATLVLTALA